MRPPNRQRAYSFIELMISLGVSTVIFGVAIFFLSSGKEQRNLATYQQRLLNQHQSVFVTLQQDLNTAVKNTGYTGNLYPGIARLDPTTGQIAGPRANSTDNDALLIYAGEFDQFKVPISAPQLNGGNLAVDIGHINSEDDLSYNISRFLKSYSQVSPFIVVTNPTFTNIFPVNSVVADNSISITADSFSTNAGQVTGSNVMGAISRIEWILSNGVLTRQKRGGILPNSPILETQIMATNARKFQINYIFNSTRGSKALKTPGQLISHINDSLYTCNPTTQNCIQWQDLAALQVTAEYASPKFLKSIDVKDGVFAADGGKLVFSRTETLHPEQFSGRAMSTDTVGADFACLNTNPASRCSKNCVGSFHNTDPSALDWEGYGRYMGTTDPLGPSNYCVCGYNPQTKVFTPPETDAGIADVANYVGPGYLDASGANDSSPYSPRIKYCVKHFNTYAGADYRWMWKGAGVLGLDPMTMALNFCFSGPNQTQTATNGTNYWRSGTPGNYSYNIGFLNSIKNGYDAWKTDKTHPPSYMPYIACGWANACDSALRLLLNDSHVNDDLYRPWGDQCDCYVRWDKTCNIGVTRQEDLVCPQWATFVGGQKVYTTDATSPMVSDMQWKYPGNILGGICSCLEAAGWTSILPGTPSQVMGWGKTYQHKMASIDFRKNPPDPVTMDNFLNQNTQAQMKNPDAATFTTLLASYAPSNILSATYNYRNNVGDAVQPTTANRCDDFLCTYGREELHGGAACCSASTQTFANRTNVTDPAGAYAQLLAGYTPPNQDYSSFCSDRCVLWNGWELGGELTGSQRAAIRSGISVHTSGPGNFDFGWPYPNCGGNPPPANGNGTQ